MERRDTIILRKIVTEANIAVSMIRDYTLEEFIEDEKTKRATCMTIINIGELVKTLSPEVRSANSHVPWKDIAGFRDIAAHKYQTLRMKDVYDTVRLDLPNLVRSISEILNEVH